MLLTWILFCTFSIFLLYEVLTRRTSYYFSLFWLLWIFSGIPILILVPQFFASLSISFLFIIILIATMRISQVEKKIRELSTKIAILEEKIGNKSSSS